MTIKVAATRNEFTATASQTVFNYTFKIFSSTDLNVFQTPAGQVCNDSTDQITAFTVTGVGNEDGGAITLTVGATVGDLITIVSDIPSTRTTDYQNNGDFIPKTVNDDFDRVVSLVKQAEEVANRTLVSAECQQGTKPLTLPEPVAGQLIRWNGAVTGMENVSPGSLSPATILEQDISKQYTTVAAMKADASIVAGRVVVTQEHTTGFGFAGGNRYLSRAVTGGTDDNGSLIKSTGNTAIEFVGLFPSGRVDAKQFGAKGGNGSTDDFTAIQAAIIFVEIGALLPQIFLSGDDIYGIGTQLVLNSVVNSGMKGIYGTPTIKWIGATLNPVTQDDSTGAMIFFSGTDHSFGGLENLFIFAESKANFCVFLEGIVNTQFKMSHLHMKHAQLDLIIARNSASLGPVQLNWDHLDAFPFTTFGGVNAVCGRHVINFDMNSSSGIIKLSNCNFDNGKISVIAIQGATFAGNDVILDNIRWEGNATNVDFVVTNYTAVTSTGMILLINCKGAQALGSLRAVVHNISTVNNRAIVHIDKYLMLNAPTNIYLDDNDSTKDILHNNKYLQESLRINESAQVSILPLGNGMPAAPAPGTYDWRNSSLNLEISNGTDTFNIRPDGISRVAAFTSNHTVLLSEHGTTFTNNGAAGTVIFTLPAISTVPLGTEYRFIATFGQIVTVDPDAVDDINFGGAGVAISSSGAQSEIIKVVAASGDTWIITEREGIWA